MNIYQFGRLINKLTLWGMRELDTVEMIELDAMVNIIPSVQEVQTRPVVKESDVDALLSCMGQEGKKIEAIKHYRWLTNAGLRKSKDAVEKYWR